MDQCSVADLLVEVDGQQHEGDHDRLGAAAGAHVHHERVVEPQTRGQPRRALPCRRRGPGLALEDAVDEEPCGHVAQHEEQLAQVGAPGDVGQHEVGEQRAVPVGVPLVGRAAVPDVPRRVRDHLVMKGKAQGKETIVFSEISLTALPCSPRRCT